jgi:hypothetical protein
MFPVDLAYQAVDFIEKLRILGAVLSRWDCNLDQFYFLLPVRVVVEKLIEGAQFLGNPFDIIQAIYADDDFHAIQLPFQDRGCVSGFVLAQEIVEFFWLYTYWERGQVDNPVFDVDSAPSNIHIPTPVCEHIAQCLLGSVLTRCPHSNA